MGEKISGERGIEPRRHEGTKKRLLVALIVIPWAVIVAGCNAPEPREGPGPAAPEKASARPAPTEPARVEHAEAEQHPGVSAPETRSSSRNEAAAETPPKPAVRPAPEPPPASQPEASRADKPAEKATEKAPELPPYIVRAIPIDPRQPLRLNARTRDPSSLLLDTGNLRRIRITRNQLPLAKNRSVAVLIDGQGIEWTTNSSFIELERTPAGAWQVVGKE